MGKIALLGVEIYGTIGVYKEEQQAGRRFSIDMVAEYPLRASSLSDAVSDTLNYELMLLAIQRQMQKPHHLLEHVARAIGEEIIKEYPELLSLRITIRKLRPFLAGPVESASVEWLYPEDY